MTRTLNVHLLPSLTTPERLAGRTVVVIDVLRAGTTIACALAVGAREVIPCLEVEEARKTAGRIGPQAILAGERDGLPIAGFDLGNSPGEFTAERVGGKTVVFTTTNGTAAMMRAKKASRIFIAGLVNFAAVCRKLANEQSVELLCAGTRGQVSREDVLLAGAIVDDLTGGPHGPGGELELNDQALLAADAWRAAAGEVWCIPLAQRLRNTHGGRSLIEIGQEHDIELAAEMDKLDVVPELDTAAWRIRLP